MNLVAFGFNDVLFVSREPETIIISERESGVCHASCQKCSQIRDEREREYFFDSDPWARAQPLARRKC